MAWWNYCGALFKGVFLCANGFLLSLPTYLSVFAVALRSIPWLWPGFPLSKVKPVADVLRHHPALIIMSLVMLSVIITSYSLYVNKASSFATPDELIPSVLESKTIRIVDLARDDFIIRNRTFKDCHIYGPAMICPSGCTFVKFTMDAPPKACLVETPNEYVAGAISLENCLIEGCSFHRVGIIGEADMLRQIRQAIVSDGQ